MPIIEVRNLAKNFKHNQEDIVVLQDASFALEEGQTLAILGPSGIGKSTLLHIIALLLRPDKGEVIYKGRDILQIPHKEQCLIRSSEFALIKQDFAILETENAFKNIALPLEFQKEYKRSTYKNLAHIAAKKVGIEGLLKRNTPAGKMSGGEKQRIAIARALVADQKLILADEPTGSLDEDNKEKIIDLLFALCKNDKKSMILVTHDSVFAKRCDIVLKLNCGRLVQEK